MDFLVRMFLEAILEPLAWLRRTISLDGRMYALLHVPPLQALLERIGDMRAHAVFLKAKKSCPAYRNFLTAEGYKIGRAHV